MYLSFVHHTKQGTNNSYWATTNRSRNCGFISAAVHLPPSFACFFISRDSLACLYAGLKATHDHRVCVVMWLWRCSCICATSQAKHDHHAVIVCGDFNCALGQSACSAYMAFGAVPRGQVTTTNNNNLFSGSRQQQHHHQQQQHQHQQQSTCTGARGVVTRSFLRTVGHNAASRAVRVPSGGREFHMARPALGRGCAACLALACVLHGESCLRCGG